MPALDCPTRAELDSFQAGELNDVALTSVASHVESCSKCQRSLETIIGDSSDTVLSALLAEPVANPFAEEVACQMVIDRVSSMARDEKLAGKETAPTIALDNPRNPAGESTLPVETIREYKLLAKLGEGGMGAVYKALHTRLDKVVALKVLPEGRIRDAGSVARFQREMKAVGRLDHPNIVRAMDAGEENGMHFLVMEYVEGADLSVLAKSTGPLPVAAACELVRQAAVGLQEAHEHGMVHRDIKPSNLILAKSPRKKSPPTLKILDLGLALLSEGLAPDQELTSTGQMMGTIDYMAPEQGSDTHHVDIRADIYSLGATLYRLLTGWPPFSGEKFDTPVKKILALATKEPAAVGTLRADVPPALASILHKMLAKDPSNRYATPEELAEALTPFCQGANLAVLFARGTQSAQSKVSGEAPTHPQLSSPSVATASTFLPPLPLGEGRGEGAGAASARKVQKLRLAGLGRKIPRSLAIAAACGGAALVVLLGVVFYLETLKGTIRIEIDDDKIKVALDEKGATFEGIDKMHSVRVQPGPHGLTVTRGDLKFDTDKFELRKGETLRLSVKFLAGRVQVIDAANGKSLGNSSWHGWPEDAPAPAIAPFDAKQARKHQEEWAEYLGVPVEYENSIGMKFVLIPPGEFMMGSTPEEIESALKKVGDSKTWRECTRSEGPRHKVILTKPLYLGVHEVTQQNYETVMEKNPSHFAPQGKGKDAVKGITTGNHPVDSVSWNDAAEFCAKLSQNEKLKPFSFRKGDVVTPLEGTGYCLPTEAEWEFVCRAGTTTKYWIADNEDLIVAAWSSKNAGGRTHAVGELKANPFGLYDVHGNIWEWVQDVWDPAFYGQFGETPAIDPRGPIFAGAPRVFRGGCFANRGFNCWASFRNFAGQKESYHHFGFRVTLTVEAVKAAIAERKTRSSTVNTSWHGWPKDAPKPAIAPFTAEQAKKHQQEWAAYLKVDVEYENSLGMKFILIPPGEFLMGSTPEEIEKAIQEAGSNNLYLDRIRSEAPQHQVILTQPVYLGVHEVTQSEYEQLIGKNPSFFSKTSTDKAMAEKVAGMDTSRFPVEGVNWREAADFCTKLSEREKLSPAYFSSGILVTNLKGGNGYRLPTEAQWEFACRAGTTTKYWKGDKEEDLFQAGWTGANSGGRPHAVGELLANPFGLYDVHGNEFEFMEDWWAPEYFSQFQSQPAVDPKGSPTGYTRVTRGGQLNGSSRVCRSSARGADDPSNRTFRYGIRLSISVEGVKTLIAASKNQSAAGVGGWHGWPANAPKPAIAPFTAEQAKKHQQEWATYLNVDVEYKNSLDMQFVLIPPGEFTMGSTDAEIEAALAVPGSNEWAKETVRGESPPHKVILTQPIYLAIHEVTQEQFEKVTGENPSHFSPTGKGKNDFGGKDRTKCPAECVAWIEAAKFCAMLSEREKLKPFYLPTGEIVASAKGTAYRLPTEAQWEFACRSGTTTKYWTGDKDEDLPQAAWFKQNAKGLPQPVGMLKPNPFGLYDVHGNIWEWVHDWWEAGYYGQFKDKPAIDPSGPASPGSVRMIRGGNWSFTASDCRSAGRLSGEPLPIFRSSGIGFRVAIPVDVVRAAIEVHKIPMTSTDPDRNAAKWVLSIGSTISIKTNGMERTIGAIDDLPQGAFELTGVNLSKNLLVNDAGLAVFKDCKNITGLYLAATKVSKAGLAHFKDCKNLTILGMGDTKVGNAGLAHFKDCKNLMGLWLHSTLVSDTGLADTIQELPNIQTLNLAYSKVSDAGLVHLQKCKNLKSLTLSGCQVSDAGLELLAACPQLTSVIVEYTKVTDAGAKKLSAALPECTIRWQGGVIEP